MRKRFINGLWSLCFKTAHILKTYSVVQDPRVINLLFTVSVVTKALGKRVVVDFELSYLEKEDQSSQKRPAMTKEIGVGKLPVRFGKL